MNSYQIVFLLGMLVGGSIVIFGYSIFYIIKDINKLSKINTQCKNKK